MRKFISFPLIIAMAFSATIATANAATTDLTRTGQVTCYDAVGTAIACADTGQDGELRAGMAWKDPQFTDNGDGTVTDELTGLMWLTDANCMANNYPGVDVEGTPGDGYVYWQTALDFVAGINGSTYPLCQAGHTDWRLPNVHEIKSLLDYGANSPALPAGHPFSSVMNAYWSSTTYSSFRDNAFAVLLFNGRVLNGDKDNSQQGVLPVRDSGQAGVIAVPKTKQDQCYATDGSVRACAGTGEDAEFGEGTAWPDPRFTDNGDGTVTDELTGLIWLADVSNCTNADTWANALTMIDDLNASPATFHAKPNCDYTGTHGDWRLPNVRELDSLLHYDHSVEGAFGNIAGWLNSLGVGFEAVGAYHWTSTSKDGGAADAWAATFASSVIIGHFAKTNAYYIWPVRGGLYGDPDIAVSPSSIDFGDVLITSSADQDITVTNEGTQDLFIDALTAPAAPFSVTGDACSDVVLEPGQSCVVSVRFEPTDETNSSDSIDVPSDDPDEATVTVQLAGNGTTTPNQPPAAFDLVYPSDGATGLAMPVTMIWKATTDPDGDAVSYDINYCEDDTFAGCDPILNVAKATAQPLSSRITMLARAWIKSLVMGPFTLIGCGGGSSTPDDLTPNIGPDEMSYTATDLNPGTTYYWKVIANDTNGGSTESAVWSFSTQ